MHIIFINSILNFRKKKKKTLQMYVPLPPPHSPPTTCLPLKIIDASSIFYGICPKTDQVIYTSYSNCMPDIMILAQAVLQLFCSQVSFTTQYAKVIRLLYYTTCQRQTMDIIQPNVYRILPNVNHVIYNLDTIRIMMTL